MGCRLTQQASHDLLVMLLVIGEAQMTSRCMPDMS